VKPLSSDFNVIYRSPDPKHQFAFSPCILVSKTGRYIFSMDISDTYGKKVMIAETSYAYTPDDSDFFANTIGNGFGCVDGYPFTQQGQAKHIRDLIDMVVNKANAGIGVFYWEGTWISVGGSSYEENLSLWQKFGSGWATSYAGEYDTKDAGQWYGGCAVENQALFDERGRALESLKIFNLVKTGTDN